LFLALVLWHLFGIVLNILFSVYDITYWTHHEPDIGHVFYSIVCPIVAVVLFVHLLHNCCYMLFAKRTAKSPPPRWWNNFGVWYTVWAIIQLILDVILTFTIRNNTSPLTTPSTNDTLTNSTGTNSWADSLAIDTTVLLQGLASIFLFSLFYQVLQMPLQGLRPRLGYLSLHCLELSLVGWQVSIIVLYCVSLYQNLTGKSDTLVTIFDSIGLSLLIGTIVLVVVISILMEQPQHKEKRTVKHVLSMLINMFSIFVALIVVAQLIYNSTLGFNPESVLAGVCAFVASLESLALFILFQSMTTFKHNLLGYEGIGD